MTQLVIFVLAIAAYTLAAPMGAVQGYNQHLPSGIK